MTFKRGRLQGATRLRACSCVACHVMPQGVAGDIFYSKSRGTGQSAALQHCLRTVMIGIDGKSSGPGWISLQQAYCALCNG